MGERYNRVFSLQENLYAVGAPVIVAAGALLLDNQSGGVVGQLKIKNISSRIIKTVRVRLSLFDSMNRPIGSPIEYKFLDLSAKRGETFGTQNAIRILDTSTRAYAVEVVEVGFHDGTIWTTMSDLQWAPLSKQKTLLEAYGEKELVKQFKIEYGDSAEFLPLQNKDLWFCFCGAVNHQNEQVCFSCGSSRDFDLDALVERCGNRVSAEIEATKKEEDLKTAKRKRTQIRVIVASSLLVLAVAIALLLVYIVIPEVKYKRALTKYEKGLYDEAYNEFEDLDGYKDSFLKMTEVKKEKEYQLGIENMEKQLYLAATIIFAELGTYKDCPQKLAEAQEKVYEEKYGNACEYLENGLYNSAINLFEELKDYRDSKEQIVEARYREAIRLIDFKEYFEAYKLLYSLKPYSDSEYYMKRCISLELEKYKPYEGTFYCEGKYKLTVKFGIDESQFKEGLSTEFVLYISGTNTFLNENYFAVNTKFIYDQTPGGWFVSSRAHGRSADYYDFYVLEDDGSIRLGECSLYNNRYRHVARNMVFKKK